MWRRAVLLGVSAASTAALLRPSSLPLSRPRRPLRTPPSALGDMFAKLGFGGSSSAFGLASRPDAFDASTTPSWEALRATYDAQATPEEAAALLQRDAGRGPAHASATLRLFDAAEGTEPAVVLYRDSASWCPYCQKVWLVLEELRVPYAKKTVPMSCYGDKPGWFRRLSPSGQIPIAEMDGRVVSESNDIIVGLLQQYQDRPGHRRLHDFDDARANELLRLERQLFSAWMRWVTVPGSSRQRGQFLVSLDAVERALRESAGARPGASPPADEPVFFLGGEAMTLVDIQFAPFLERMAASVLYYKGLQIRGGRDGGQYPWVEAWFRSMEATPSYIATRSDHYTNAYSLPPQIGGCYEDGDGPDVSAIQAEIDGRNGGWSVAALSARDAYEPVVLSEGKEPDEDLARKEAALSILSNHEAVVPFACRALGKPGFPPARADLADPNATPNEAFEAYVDAALRAAVHSLLSGPDVATAAMVSGGNPAAAREALAYLRDRVGVPRDVSWAAARHLRAHLNVVIDALPDEDASSMEG